MSPKQSPHIATVHNYVGIVKSGNVFPLLKPWHVGKLSPFKTVSWGSIEQPIFNI